MKQLVHRGVSLIEAMVALAVMAFGMLGIVGLQGTMRLNADVAKQRAEAVRIAQEQIELWRRFDTLVQYRDGIVSIPETVVAGPNNTNTTYRITATVTPPPANPPVIPPFKTAVVRVDWTDRSDVVQSVTLTTRINGSSPALGAALAVPAYGTPTWRPWGRHAGIPPTAVPQGNGTSRFVPPGSGNVGWVFNNATGVIVQVCDAGFASCLPSNRQLLTGYVRYAFRISPGPSPLEAETPVYSPGFPFPVGVRVTMAGTGDTVDCAVDQRPTFTEYFCALELAIPPSTPPQPPNRPSWSGRANLRGFNIASDVSDNDSSRFRVCRYTSVRNNNPPGGNVDHPLDYVRVTTPLSNQNFLIIRAGNDTTAFECPRDDTSTPYVNGNTYDHQPPQP